MNTASSRIWTFATVIAMILVVALGWFLGMSPKLAEAARFDTERQSVAAQNDIARATIAQLEADFENIDELREQIAELRAEFPTDAAYDTAVEELLAGLITAGLTLQTVTINEPAPTSATTLADGETPPEPEIDGDGVLPSGSLLRISVSVTVNGSLGSSFAFIEALQKSPRFSIVSRGDFSEGAAESGGRTTFDLILYAVSGEDLLAVAPTEPAPEQTAAPEPSASPEPGAVDPSATPSPEPTP